MNKNIQNLYKLFGIFAMTIYYQPCHATDANVCISGKYISKCGKYYVGANWLKGIPMGSNGTDIVDFYDYASENNHNMENLRNFFSGQGQIVYTPKNGGPEETRDASELVTGRNQLLKKYCFNSAVIDDYHGETWEEASLVQCEACPDDGYTGQSLVSYDQGLTNLRWDLRVISDCYFENKFSDATGEYYYDYNEGEPNTCYYNSLTKGSLLPEGQTTETSDVCDPACTDGQTCENGSCVTTSSGPSDVCNPECTDGQTCENGTCVTSQSGD